MFESLIAHRVADKMIKFIHKTHYFGGVYFLDLS